MMAATKRPKPGFPVSMTTGLVLLCALLFNFSTRAEDFSFTNYVAQAALAEARRDISAALKIFAEAEARESGNVTNLCVLSRHYCDLMYLTNSASAKRDLLQRALHCAQQAVSAGPENATAHACLGVCCAQSCAFANIKGELDYSRRFKFEAEKTIAIDPKQDIAYYLLGRWHYGVANVGLLSRAYVKIVYSGLPKASNEDAVKIFQKAIELAPDRIIHHAGLAMVYAATGERNRQIAELEKCRALKPADREDEAARREAEKRLAALGK